MDHFLRLGFYTRLITETERTTQGKITENGTVASLTSDL